MDRATTLKKLADDPVVDVLVIGAGINGIGTFRDLGLQGARTLLVDQGDFCSGCSSASSHMAHGGIRYLENGEFRLVSEAVNERNRLILNAPHLVKPLPTIVPMFKIFSGLLNAPFKFLDLLDRPSERGALVIKVGLMFYDALTRGQRVVPRHRFEGRKKSLERWPDLDPTLKFTALYYDGQLVSPERLCVELALDATGSSERAMALTYAPVIGVEVDGESNEAVVMIRDEMGGTILKVRPRVIVNAGGPWIDSVNGALGSPTAYIGGTKGSHIVVDNPALRKAMGEHEFFFENKDGRIVLMLAWYDRVVIGTSDIPVKDAEGSMCTDEEIEYFIGLAGRLFPTIPVTRQQIVFTFSGVRPLPRSGAKNAGQISRDHSIEETRVGAVPVLSLVSGKWTTFRAFAGQVTDKALARLGMGRRVSTEGLPIGGGADWPATPAAMEEAELALVKKHGIPFDRAQALFALYGSRAGLVLAAVAPGSPEAMLASLPSYSRQEVAFLAREEGAEHLDDLILRRSTIAWRGLATASVLEELCDIMAIAKGWSPSLRDAELVRTTAILRERHGGVVRA
ncbi:MAG: glycerol-3-phosphate dehydrogenase/oxidase [Spirochaetota bacterium]